MKRNNLKLSGTEKDILNVTALSNIKSTQAVNTSVVK
jgi:hypothetical protein